MNNGRNIRALTLILYVDMTTGGASHSLMRIEAMPTDAIPTMSMINFFHMIHYNEIDFTFLIFW